MATYKLNEVKMFCDITDGIAIIINSETGIYYGLNSFGTTVLENILNGVSTENILSALKSIDGVPAGIETDFNAFVKALVDSELVIEANAASDASASIATDIASKDEFKLEVREYNDAQELLLADPIHEVKEETGWSPEKSALNPDKDDVARREAKVKK